MTKPQKKAPGRKASEAKARPPKAGLRTTKAPPKTPIAKITAEQQIIGATFLGKVQDYFAKAGVIAVTLEAPLSVGDTIRVKGHTTDLTQKVESIQVQHQSVQSASPGEGVGVKIADRVRAGDAVYKL